jgi:hypothetical protein
MAIRLPSLLRSRARIICTVTRRRLNPLPKSGNWCSPVRGQPRPGSGTVSPPRPREVGPAVRPRSWQERPGPPIGDISVLLSPQPVDLLLRRLNPFQARTAPKSRNPNLWKYGIKRRAIAHDKLTLGSCRITAACPRQVPGCCKQAISSWRG